MAQKFVDRSAGLATDGFIVYDIQDEAGRTPDPRPFPFRKLDDPSHFGREFHFAVFNVYIPTPTRTRTRTRNLPLTLTL